MKRFLAILFFLSFSLNLSASHIVGGEVAYTYLGPGSAPNTSRYSVLLRLFTECNQVCGGNTNVACPPVSPIIGIFINGSPYTRITNLTLALVENPQLNLGTYPPCLDVQPIVCYKVNTYMATVTLADNAVGYRLAYQSCCRAASLNVSANAGTLSGVPGATYEATLPGTNILATGHNSSALVNLKDTALICYSSPFTLEFSAVDTDLDSLSYHFVSAYNGGSFTGANDAQAPDLPLYGVVTYQGGYSGASPLGASVTINPNTGIISGISPAAIGKYVVNVLIREWRSGVLIAEHRKDFLVRTNECTITKANLNIIPVTCDGNTVDFSQFNTSSGNITEYRWIFGDPASGPLDTSFLPGPSHFYATPGIYTVRLRVSSGGICIDSTQQDIGVFPGFNPDFEFAGKCKNTPILFTDKTTFDHGILNLWQWDFGETGSPTNTSTLQNPTHTYASANSYNVRLIVGSSVGCIDTINKTIDILDQPPLSVLPKDTLICNIDTLQLNATGTGTFTWSPNYMIDNINNQNPLVSPDITTTYRVTLTDAFGCSGYDSIKVHVVDRVTQFAGPDTSICRTDPVILQLTSDALHYVWTENPPGGNTLNNPFIKNPTATPLVTTTYHVVGNIGKCIAENDIKVTPVPYPIPNAGPDNTICFGQSAQLNASGGSIYSWSPAAFLTATNIPNPRSVNPTDNVRYIVTVRDILGCPKPVKDTMFLYVAKIKANAGPRDTSVVLDQPLQLNATGSINYQWTPGTWLNNPLISNPIALPRNNIEYIVRVSNNAGCFDFDSIRVRVFTIRPDLLVPNAFTPNGDGNNDVFKPIPIGMKSLDVFRVYNRWGEMVYSGSGNDAAWDGTYGGKKQEMATFVWYAEGVDYLNNKIKRKGSVVLIR
ncbi:MAG: gliding motility-associated C-terminal domain-containing protein [Ferruginibacter sp.]|nr:gliding motility-associated C-terminal domain-containing protein [Ferruginibacter sp.]